MRQITTLAQQNDGATTFIFRYLTFCHKDARI